MGLAKEGRFYRLTCQLLETGNLHFWVQIGPLKPSLQEFSFSSRGSSTFNTLAATALLVELDLGFRAVWLKSVSRFASMSRFVDHDDIWNISYLRLRLNSNFSRSISDRYLEVTLKVISRPLKSVLCYIYDRWHYSS